MNQEKVILIVDDSVFDRRLLSSALSRKIGVKVVEAESGAQCLEILNAQKVDLIIMDIMMPGESGTEVLKQIRRTYNAIQLPVIMVTAKSDSTDVVDALQLGANDYVTKPVNFEVAVSRITTHLKLAEVSMEMAALQEVAALHAMVTTYNHEINNPLAIALASLPLLLNDGSSPVTLKRMEDALWRVADIVKRIREVTEKEEIVYDSYVGAGKMVKVK